MFLFPLISIQSAFLILFRLSRRGPDGIILPFPIPLSPLNTAIFNDNDVRGDNRPLSPLHL